MTRLNREILLSHKIIATRCGDLWCRVEPPLDQTGENDTHIDAILSFDKRPFGIVFFDGIRVANAWTALGLMPQHIKTALIMPNDEDVEKTAVKYQCDLHEMEGFKWRQPDVASFSFDSFSMPQDLVYADAIPDNFQDAWSSHTQLACANEAMTKIEQAVQPLFRTRYKSLFGEQSDETDCFGSQMTADTAVFALSFGLLSIEDLQNLRDKAQSDDHAFFQFAAMDFPSIEQLFDGGNTPMSTVVEQVSSIVKIWEHLLEKDDSDSDFTNQNDPDDRLRSVGKKYGIDYAVKAYLDGVPLEHIIDVDPNGRHSIA